MKLEDDSKCEEDIFTLKRCIEEMLVTKKNKSNFTEKLQWQFHDTLPENIFLKPITKA